MDHPEFVPKFIPLENKHPDTSRPYYSEAFVKVFRTRCTQSVNRHHYDEIMSQYLVKCTEYLGYRRDANYFLFTLDKTFWERCFPTDEFVGSDPDPVYSRVFAEYFTVQQMKREDMTNQGVEMTEQIQLLTELSSLYSEKLATARKLDVQTSKKATKDDDQKGPAGVDGSKTSVPGANGDDRSGFKFVEPPNVTVIPEVPQISHVSEVPDLVEAHDFVEVAAYVEAPEPIEASELVEALDLDEDFDFIDQETSPIKKPRKSDIERDHDSWVLV